MEAVFAIGALWRWRAPVLSDMVQFFTQFGAFPSGAPRPILTAGAPVGQSDIESTIQRLDSILSPIDDDSHRSQQN
jgi:hypothetical protein